MKFPLIIALIALPLASLAQSDIIEPTQLAIKFDSVQISLWNIYFKELSSPDDEVYPSKELAKTTLSRSEANNLLIRLRKEDSYDGERANLSHHDIEIHFFLNGEKTINVELSAMTGNIDISSELNDYYFRNNCSKEFGKFVLSSLTRTDLFERAEYDEIDVEGLGY